MAEIIGSLSATKVRTDEAPFVPGESRIDIVLQPKPEEDPYYPPQEPYKPFPYGGAPAASLPYSSTKSVVIDIETTGIMPYDSRIICISAIDISAPEKVQSFFGKDEREIVQKFLEWFGILGFNEIIGYNVAFDYRFIFTKAMMFRMTADKFYQADLFDLMNSMKQIKSEFVYGFNKPGTFDEWTEYFFGEVEPMTTDQMMKAWKEGRVQDIVNANRKGTQLTLMLWALVKYTRGELNV